MARTWSPQQTAIFHEVENGEGNLVVIARAGSGKTTTIEECVNRCSGGMTRVLLLAFNKDICAELRRRVHRRVDVMTTHGFGFQVLCRTWEPHLKAKISPERHRVRQKQILRAAIPDPFYSDKAVVADISKLVQLAKATLPQNNNELINLMGRHSCYPIGQYTTEMYCDWVSKACKVSREPSVDITYDEMVYVPARLGWKTGFYDIVFVDETQDLNAAQIKIAKAAVRDEHSRIIAFGDDRQALYAFRGADESAIFNLITALKAKTLPLSTTYRCPKSVVDLVNEFVPDFQAAPEAPEGVVMQSTEAQMKKSWAPGDFVLSRTNAPLAQFCLAALGTGLPAHIQGRDVGGSLSTLIYKSKADTVEELTAWLTEWAAREASRLTAANEEERIEEIYDKVAAIGAISEGFQTAQQVLDRIEHLFDDAKEGIIFSTVHKAKGLETNRVWMLESTFRPHKNVEEENLYYVAATRAKQELHLVQLEKRKR